VLLHQAIQDGIPSASLLNQLRYLDRAGWRWFLSS